MDIKVALDGEKRRDLEFFPGDDTVINVAVFNHDGDVDPIDVTDLILAVRPGPNQNTMTPGDTFTAAFCQRDPFTLTGVVGTARTTLAYGLLVRRWIDPTFPGYRCGCWDYGGPYVDAPYA